MNKEIEKQIIDHFMSTGAHLHEMAKIFNTHNTVIGRIITDHFNQESQKKEKQKKKSNYHYVLKK